MCFGNRWCGPLHTLPSQSLDREADAKLLEVDGHFSVCYMILVAWGEVRTEKFVIILYEGNCKFFHWRGDGGVSIVSIFFVFITDVLRGYKFNFCFLGE